MARIRSRGNRDTELALRAVLRRERITGWRRQIQIRNAECGDRNFKVRPDFVFPKRRAAIFVDGCYWHGCPYHCRMPVSHRRYWLGKIARNRARDRKVNRALRAQGWKVLRIWEHELARKREAGLIRRIRRALNL